MAKNKKTKVEKSVEEIIKDEVVEEIIKDEVVEVKPKKVKFEYKLWAKLNDKEYEAETNNLDEAIFSLKPEILYTALHLKITKGGKTVDKYLYLKDARRLFTNSLTRFVFVKNLNLLF